MILTSLLSSTADTRFINNDMATSISLPVTKKIDFSAAQNSRKMIVTINKGN